MGKEIKWKNSSDTWNKATGYSSYMYSLYYVYNNVRIKIEKEKMRERYFCVR